MLIAYYSHSGNTGQIARWIAEITKGDLYEIQPRKAYPQVYKQLVIQAMEEVRAEAHPPLKELPVNMKRYQTVFVGSPNWWGALAPPVSTFLRRYDFTGKMLIPFVTHGGSGIGKVTEGIRRYAPGAQVKNCFQAHDGACASKRELEEWIGELQRHLAP